MKILVNFLIVMLLPFVLRENKKAEKQPDQHPHPPPTQMPEDSSQLKQQQPIAYQLPPLNP